MSVADKLGLGPVRRVQVMAGFVRIEITPPGWAVANPQTKTVRLTPEQYIRYERWQAGAGYIQSLLPDLTDDEREILMNGAP